MQWAEVILVSCTGIVFEIGKLDLAVENDYPIFSLRVNIALCKGDVIIIFMLRIKDLFKRASPPRDDGKGTHYCPLHRDCAL